MPRIACLITVPLLALLILPALGQPGDAAERIAWSKDLASGMARAKEAGRPLLICINAKYVEGRRSLEPAAKGLREVVYKDPRIVKRSRDFVCVLLTPRSGTRDYGELRVLGIDGQMVSPQHIFVGAAGKRILLRQEYWTHGQGESAVEALLALMDKAQAAAAAPAEAPEEAPGGEDASTEDVARAEWILRRLVEVTSGGPDREQALAALVKADRDGDCTGPLIELLPEHKRDTEFLRLLIRALGRDGLEEAAPPIARFLGHRDSSIRANAAVSLEYIGSRDKKVVSALMKAAGKQKDEAIANHMYRALGRCGVKEGAVRALLLKKAGSGKSEFATYGPAIGLAYFEDDAKAARGVEKLLKLVGIPGSRRGGGQNTVKRGLLSWTLASIEDRKSTRFVREELMDKLKNVKAFWVDGLLTFWEAVARKCQGEDSEMAGIEAGVRVFVGYARRFDLGRYGAETRSLMDESRADRDTSTFKPKGDGLLEAGGGGPGPGGGPGGR